VYVTAIETVDADHDGKLDAIRITTNRPLNDDFSGLSIIVAGYMLQPLATRYDTGTVANDNEFFVRIVENALPVDTGDTNATPSVQVVTNASLAWNGRNYALLKTTLGAMAQDKAQPVLLAAQWCDASGGGVSATDTIVLTFSEPVSTVGVVAADFGLPVAGDSLSTATIADQPNTSTVFMTLMGTPLLTPGGVYTFAPPASLVAGQPTGLYLLNGNPITDSATNTAWVTAPATAVDLRPGVEVLGIAWSDLTITPKLWDLGTVDLGSTFTANPSFPPAGLIARNVGNVRSKFTISCSVAAPSGWAAAALTGQDQFQMKADNSVPLVGTFTVDLSAGPIDLATGLYSGTNKAFDLFFGAPTSITSGATIAQDITVTIIVTKD
jgi:hypothetical protein